MVLNFDVCVTEDNFSTEASNILKHLRPSWDQSYLKLKIFTEGITNTLIGYYVNDDPEDIVLFRLYGKNTEVLIDRHAELATMQLFSVVGCSAPLYATFTNGICYGFSPGQTLDPVSVRDDKIQMLVAKAFVEIHRLSFSDKDIKQPLLFPLLKKYLKLIPLSFDDEQKNKRFLEYVPRKDALWHELQVLENHLTSLGSPVVFCHNDALLKNIIYDKCKDRVTFIDYEYAGYNYQAFDIGNHFCEFSGIDTPDFSLYPNKDFQKHWLRTYLTFWRSSGGVLSSVTDREVERFYVQVNKFALASSLLWGLWGLIQSAHSAIDFDYLSFAIARLNEYFSRKDEFLSLKLPV